MKIGYARVSTQAQGLGLQVDALEKAGCEKVYTEKESTGRTRPVLNQLFDVLRKGDVLVVWKLDRLGRSVKELVQYMNKLNEMGVDIIFIEDSIDTTTAIGKFTFHIMSALAELEREQIKARTSAGLASARKQGRIGGRPQKLTSLQKTMICKAYNEGVSAKSLAHDFNVSQSTIYNLVKG